MTLESIVEGVEIVIVVVQAAVVVIIEVVEVKGGGCEMEEVEEVEVDLVVHMEEVDME